MDVIHSWAVPAFGVKTDAIPGRLNQTWLTVDKVGTFYGQCSELCGVNHAFMPIHVNVVELQEFLTNSIFDMLSQNDSTLLDKMFESNTNFTDLLNINTDLVLDSVSSTNLEQLQAELAIPLELLETAFFDQTCAMQLWEFFQNEHTREIVTKLPKYTDLSLKTLLSLFEEELLGGLDVHTTYDWTLEQTVDYMVKNIDTRMAQGYRLYCYEENLQEDWLEVKYRSVMDRIDNYQYTDISEFFRDLIETDLETYLTFLQFFPDSMEFNNLMEIAQNSENYKVAQAAKLTETPTNQKNINQAIQFLDQLIAKYDSLHTCLLLEQLDLADFQKCRQGAYDWKQILKDLQDLQVANLIESANSASLTAASNLENTTTNLLELQYRLETLETLNKPSNYPNVAINEFGEVIRGVDLVEGLVDELARYGCYLTDYEIDSLYREQANGLIDTRYFETYELYNYIIQNPMSFEAQSARLTCYEFNDFRIYDELMRRAERLAETANSVDLTPASNLENTTTDLLELQYRLETLETLNKSSNYPNVAIDEFGEVIYGVDLVEGLVDELARYGCYLTDYEIDSLYREQANGLIDTRYFETYELYKYIIENPMSFEAQSARLTCYEFNDFSIYDELMRRAERLAETANSVDLTPASNLENTTTDLLELQYRLETLETLNKSSNYPNVAIDEFGEVIYGVDLVEGLVDELARYGCYLTDYEIDSLYREQANGLIDTRYFETYELYKYIIENPMSFEAQSARLTCYEFNDFSIYDELMRRAERLAETANSVDLTPASNLENTTTNLLELQYILETLETLNKPSNYPNVAIDEFGEVIHGVDLVEGLVDELAQYGCYLTDYEIVSLYLEQANGLIDTRYFETYELYNYIIENPVSFEAQSARLTCYEFNDFRIYDELMRRAERLAEANYVTNSIVHEIFFYFDFTNPELYWEMLSYFPDSLEYKIKLDIFKSLGYNDFPDVIKAILEAKKDPQVLEFIKTEILNNGNIDTCKRYHELGLVKFDLCHSYVLDIARA